MQTLPLRSPDMEAMLRRWAVRLQHAAPSLAAIALILLIAWLLAQLTWALLPQAVSVAGAGAYTPPLQTAARQPVAGSIADRHLFGTASQGGGNLSNAPDTTLALTLHGIVAGKDPKDSRALIVANGDEEPYAVGAALPGGAVIRAIFPDRVLLERGGRVEALRLPKSDIGQGQTLATTQGDDQAPPPLSTPVPQNLGELRQQIAQNPQRLMDVIRAMPVQEQGKLTGYRIYPAGNSPLFAQLGLHPGDVVTAVNGIPLTDPAQSIRILAALKTSEQISITMLRNGQTQTQVLQMPSGGSAQDP